MYTNETTAVINILNAKTGELMHPAGHEHPYVLRVPAEDLDGGSVTEYLRNLNGSRDLRELLEVCVTRLSDYYFGEIRMYVIQEDATHVMTVSDVLESVPENIRKTVAADVRGALEACASRFKVELPEDTEECVKILLSKGMTPYTVTLFVQNHLLDTYPTPEEKAYVASLLKS